MRIQEPMAVPGDMAAMTADRAANVVSGLEHEIGKVIVGQHLLIRRLLTGLFAAIPFSASRGKARAGCGHLLLEGVPGVAKTLTATTLAQAISAKFQRIQLTPDLLPADILGTRIYDAKSATFRIEQGPIFTNILLADEINRATPKTQSALLEAMQERQVTLADTTFPLDDPFWVLATQNPVEQEGVYTLPEAQLDRFSMMLRVGYPSAGEEEDMLHVRMTETTIERRVSPADVNVLREFIRASVFVDDKIIDLHRPSRPRDAGARGGRPRRSEGAAAARHLAALVSAHPRARARHRVHARPDVGAAGRRQGAVLRHGAAPHRAHRSCAGRKHRGRRNPHRAARRRCRSHDPRARDARAAVHRGVHGEEDPESARRRVSEPAARRGIRLRRASAVPRRRRRAADRLERDGANGRALRPPHARRARDERDDRDGRVALDGARHVQVLEKRGDDVHHRHRCCSRASPIRSTPASSRSATASSRPPRRAARARRHGPSSTSAGRSPRPPTSTTMLPAIQHLSKTLKRMSVVFIVSDFMTSDDVLRSRELAQLAARHDVIAVVPEDRSEAELPPGLGYLRMRDLESGREASIGLSSRARRKYADAARRAPRGADARLLPRADGSRVRPDRPESRRAGDVALCAEDERMTTRSWSIGHLVIWSILVSGAIAAAAQAPAPKPASAPVVRTSLDRTAVWIADRFTFRGRRRLRHAASTSSKTICRRTS